MERLNHNSTPNETTPYNKNSFAEAEKSDENIRVFLGKTQDGVSVYDRKVSHIHPEGGLTPELLQSALSAININGRKKVAEHVKFDRPIGEQTCVEIGPDDDVVKVFRKDRSGPSLMVKNREGIPCDTITAVLGKDFDYNDDRYVLITSYIGTGSPREPWDPSLESNKLRQESKDFWKSHALLYNENDIDWEKTKAFDSLTEEDKKKELIRERTLYSGIFVNSENLHQKIHPSLEKVIMQPHVTTNFRPETIQDLKINQLGKKVRIIATGYANNGKNEGLLVRIETDDPVLQEACNKIKNPHITLSIDKFARAKDTIDLPFKPLEEEFELTGEYGLSCFNKIIHSENDFDSVDGIQTT